MAGAEPLTLINTLATRPLFTWESQGVVQTRTLAPGQRVALEPGLFSGLGVKEVALSPGIYYLARLGALPRLYQLPSHQTLVLNHSGRAVPFGLGGTEAVLATGTLALGESTPERPLVAQWSDPEGRVQTATLEAGRVYRLVLDSPEGLGTTISLKLWD
jgi:hypothetical protein